MSNKNDRYNPSAAFRFPPPPQRQYNADSNSGGSRNMARPPPPPPPPAPPHVTTEAIPPLSSAPPSGNFNPELQRIQAEEDRHLAETLKDIAPAGSFTPPVVQQQPPPPVTAYTLPETEPDPLPITTFMRTELSLLAKRQSHIPIVVVGTEKAHQLAWKNNLRLTDLMEGLAQDLGGAAQQAMIPPFRSATKSMAVHWEDLNISFDTPDEVARPISYAQAADMLQANAKLLDKDGNLQQELNLLEDQIDNLLQNDDKYVHHPANDVLDGHDHHQRQLQQVTKDAYQLTSPLNIPWLLRYRHALDYSTNGMQHEFFGCPPILLKVCTTSETSPLLEILRELGAIHHLPECFHSDVGLYDPAALRHEVLVLHDAVDGPREWDETALRQSLQRTFGNAAGLLWINSIPHSTAAAMQKEETTDIWGGGGKCGHCMSQSDRLSFRKYLANMVTSSLLPALERRISDLNVIVNDRKKGVKNVFKSFWRKPKGEETGGDPSTSMARGEVAYRFDTIESQTRLLADTLFVIQDYDAALGMYRLIKDDYKHDKALIHYASVLEMMGLCLFFMDPFSRGRDIFGFWESALFSYSKAADEEMHDVADAQKAGGSRPTTATHATRMATRLCLMLSATEQICKGRQLEVADLLASASSHETALGAAVLLEQSAAHYYQAELFRKYAFHMLMSGHMFRTAMQEHHAFRCFTSALYLYRNDNWNDLHNHLRSALAAQLFSMERMACSIQLYCKLVGITAGGGVSSKSQQKFVMNLMEICSKHTKKALVGADRMAAPASMSAIERDKFRKERFEKIVEVIRFTPGSQRVLELPNVNLPIVDDQSLTVTSGADPALAVSKEVASLGVLKVGEESMWQELSLTATAELRAHESSKVQKLEDEVVTNALARISDLDIRQVVGQIDREKQNRHLVERGKRLDSYKEQPRDRARMEPLWVEYNMTNPLGIPIDMMDLQLVARMKSSQSVFTNEEAINISITAAKPPEERTWSFPKLHFEDEKVSFHVAEFSRLSPAGGKAWSPGKNAKEPYFVVTRQNVHLDAGAKKKVVVAICPLVLGDLEILGVRSRLLNNVWIYHPFAPLGPLLQNTRTNRANRVRAESVLLKSKVQETMPCLSIDLLKDGAKPKVEGEAPSTLLQGEIASWTIRLTNMGTAPASNITLKTNLPWVNIPAPSQNEMSPAVLEKQATSFCVGPTGTLMKLFSGTIHPGETKEVQIQIRAGLTGLQQFYMLYRYELEGQPGRYRWLRRMFELFVYPSLKVTATVVPSYWSKHEQILSVEWTNSRTEEANEAKLTVNKLLLSSRCYQLKLLPGQFAPSDVDAFDLEKEERVTAHFSISPLEPESEHCLLHEITFNQENATTHAACRDSSSQYLCLERAHRKFNTVWKKHEVELIHAHAAKDKEDQHPQSITQIRKAAQVKKQNSTMLSRESSDLETSENSETAVHPTSIARMCTPEFGASKVDLICSWRSLGDEGHAVNGQSQSLGVSVRPVQPSMYECPIALTGEHPSEIKHNFEHGPVVVPFVVTLRNQLVQESIDFGFGLDRQDSFDFIGAQSMDWSLRGGEELTVPLQALLRGPGVFDLQKIRLTIKANGIDLPYKFPLQWLVTVSQEWSC